jgi:hypothetical protein
MHPARLLAALVLLAPLLAPADASADQLDGTRFEVEERAHVVEVRVDRGFAKLVVQRTVANSGPRSDQAIFRLDLPPGAVATRLRTTGVDASGRAVWFEGDLMDAERAAAEYLELTGFGVAYPKDPALLSWQGLGRLALQVFPVPARGTKTVEYTLELPMHYAGGTYAFDLPRMGTSERAAVLHITAAHAEDRVRVNGVPVAPGGEVDASRDVTLEMSPGGGSRLSAELASVTVSAGRVFLHERVAAAPRLGEVPDHAAVAVVLDVSRSMSRAWDAELAGARAYVSRFHDAEITVVTFDRKVGLPFGASLSVSDALAHLQSFQPELGNGSQIDDAMKRADDILSRSPSPRRRILVLTDLRTRASLTPETFASASLKSGAIVHLSTVDDSGDTSLARDDDSPWAALPRKTGGVFWHASVSSGGTPAREVFEEWARPRRVDHLKVKGVPDDFGFADSLEEGNDLEYLGMGSSQPGSLVVEGELWSTPVRVSASSTADEERRWSALMFGSYDYADLSDDEQRLLAMKGRVVSPLTSYLAIEPGVRPSTDGLLLEESGIGEAGGGRGEGIGLGSIGTIGHGGASFDPQAFLEQAVARAWTAGGGRGSAEVRLESTLDEVVDFGNVVLGVPAEKAADCLREAEWGLSLPDGFTGEHDAWTIRVTERGRT